jgi:hypothetical protein
MGGGMMGQMPSANTDQTFPHQQSEVSLLLQRYCGQCHTPRHPHPTPRGSGQRSWIG